MWSREKSMFTPSEHTAEMGKSNAGVKSLEIQRSPVSEVQLDTQSD